MISHFAAFIILAMIFPVIKCGVIKQIKYRRNNKFFSVEKNAILNTVEQKK